jgi:hypothetical protein
MDRMVSTLILCMMSDTIEEGPSSLPTGSSALSADRRRNKGNYLTSLVSTLHYLAGLDVEQLLINLNSKKSRSFLLSESILDDMARKANKPSPILRAAPTRVAAYGN